MNNKVHILPAFLSLLLPGLGQFIQRRGHAGAAFLFVFLCTLFIPFCVLIFSIWQWLPSRFARGMLFGIVLSIPPLWVLVFAVLDTVLWQNNKQTHFRFLLAASLYSGFS
jgi:ATP/ADP translocase